MQIEIQAGPCTLNAHDLGVAGGYIIEAAMQKKIDQFEAENAELREIYRRTFGESYVSKSKEAPSGSGLWQ